MDNDICRVLKNFGVISGAYKKCMEEKRMLYEELQSLKNKFNATQTAEKNQNDSLLMSRKLIVEQQNVISKLMMVKEEIDSCREEISRKNEQIQELTEEKSVLLASFQQERDKIIKENQNNLKNIHNKYESEIHRLKTVIKEITANSSESMNDLNKRIEEVNLFKDQQINTLVLEYENQLKVAHAQAMQLRNDYKILIEKNHLNISAYKKRIEELEKNSTTDKNQKFVCPENKNIETYNVTKHQKSFHILNKNEMEIEEIISPCQSKPAVKRKLFNNKIDYMED